MKVSVITATYNSASTVKDTVTSVVSQTYKKIEHIIVDGASADNTLYVVNAYGRPSIVSSEKDKGIYDAMNKGISLASGNIIGILNSDDFYADPAVIEKVVETFESTGCDAVYGDLLFVDRQDTSVVTRKWIAGSYNVESFYKGWMPPHPTVFVRKEVYEQFGTFNLALKSSSDYELMLRLMLLNKIKVEYIPEVLVKMRNGGQSNKSIKNQLVAHKEDAEAWAYNKLTPNWYTVTMKPIRKIPQFITPESNRYRLQRLSGLIKPLVRGRLNPAFPQLATLSLFLDSIFKLLP